MARKKSAVNCCISPFLSANLNNSEKRFIQVGMSFLQNQDVQKLTGNAFRLYLAMVMEAGKDTVFTFPHRVAKKYGIPKSSFERGWAELVNAGMIRLLGEEPLPQFEINTYKLSLSWKLKNGNNSK